MLAGEAPVKEPGGRSSGLAGDALASLSPFHRTAADRAEELLQRIDGLSRTWYAIAAEIEDLASGPQSERPDRKTVPPSSLDPDRLAYAVRAFVTVWIILLACMYVPDLPMPPGVIPVAAAVGIEP